MKKITILLSMALLVLSMSLTSCADDLSPMLRLGR